MLSPHPVRSLKSPTVLIHSTYVNQRGYKSRYPPRRLVARFAHKSEMSIRTIWGPAPTAGLLVCLAALAPDSPKSSLTRKWEMGNVIKICVCHSRKTRINRLRRTRSQNRTQNFGFQIKSKFKMKTALIFDTVSLIFATVFTTCKLGPGRFGP